MTLEDGQRPSAPLTTDGTPPVPPTEASETLAAQEDYLRRLYDESLKWLTDEHGGEVVAHFNRDNLLEWGFRIKRERLGDDFKGGIIDGEDFVFPEIPVWDSAPGRHADTMTLPLRLEKGAILEDDGFKYGISLGRRYFGRNSDPVLSLQFGSFRLGEGLEDVEPTQLLHMLVDRSHYQSMAGEFTIHPYAQKIDIKSWADDMRLGGYGLRHWKQSELLAEEGFATSLELVQNTFSRSFTQATRTSA